MVVPSWSIHQLQYDWIWACLRQAEVSTSVIEGRQWWKLKQLFEGHWKTRKVCDGLEITWGLGVMWAAVPEHNVLVLAKIGSDFRKSGCKGRKEKRGRKGQREEGTEGGRKGDEGRKREERERREGEKGGKEERRGREVERRGFNNNYYWNSTKSKYQYCFSLSEFETEVCFWVSKVKVRIQYMRFALHITCAIT